MRSRLLALPALLCCTSLCVADKAAPAKLPPAATRTIDFTIDVQPILTRACIGCHGEEKQRGGLRLDDAAAALKGGNSGPAYRPGDSARSRLVRMVAGLDADARMPPSKNKALSSDEVGLLRAWIDQGATWPKSKSAAGVTAKSSHWAFQPIRRPSLPAIGDGDLAAQSP